jgi:hypothetical protein
VPRKIYFLRTPPPRNALRAVGKRAGGGVGKHLSRQDPKAEYRVPKQTTRPVDLAVLPVETQEEILAVPDKEYALILDVKTKGTELVTGDELRESLRDGFCYEYLDRREPTKGALDRLAFYVEILICQEAFIRLATPSPE